MRTKAKPLSHTQRALLIAAAARNDHLVPLTKLPVAAARQVIRSMLTVSLASTGKKKNSAPHEAKYGWPEARWPPPPWLARRPFP
jgi:hypothetical protein